MSCPPSVEPANEQPPAPAPIRKKLRKRRPRDYSQPVRWTVQILFAALNVWIGVEFYLFVRHYETAGRSVYVPRPAGIEGWLPIASLMGLKQWLLTGAVPHVHPAGIFILLAFLAISFLLRKSFCSWLCPVGTLSEWLWRAGRHILRRNFRLPKWADLPLRSLKYILFGLFLYVIVKMPVAGIRAFMEGPYGLISDVKMLNFFRFLSVTAAVTLGVLAVLSIFYQNFWCRYLCPYGALVGLVARFSPARIRRDPAVCIDCEKCAKACPSLLPVDRLVTVRSVECTGCLECVAVCPAEGALDLTTMLPPRRKIPYWAMAAGIAVLFVGIVGYAKAAGYWQTDLPSQVYQELVPRAHEFAHP
jgi:polyferredoxin